MPTILTPNARSVQLDENLHTVLATIEPATVDEILREGTIAVMSVLSCLTRNLFADRIEEAPSPGR